MIPKLWSNHTFFIFWRSAWASTFHISTTSILNQFYMACGVLQLELIPELHTKFTQKEQHLCGRYHFLPFSASSINRLKLIILPNINSKSSGMRFIMHRRHLCAIYYQSDTTRKHIWAFYVPLVELKRTIFQEKKQIKFERATSTLLEGNFFCTIFAEKIYFHSRKNDVYLM